MAFTVRVVDLAHRADPEDSHTVGDFPAIEPARLYACRRLRAAIEELRKPDQTAAELRQLWEVYGEETAVADGHWHARDHLDRYLATPARGFEIDWRSLEPARLLKSRAGLPMLEWRWPESSVNLPDAPPRILRWCGTSLWWSQPYWERTQPLADFVQFGKLPVLDLPPAAVLAELATALGVERWPWQREWLPEERAWREAARAQDLGQLGLLLLRDPQGLDRPAPNGETPLQSALGVMAQAATAWLLQHGANAKQHSRDGCPVLIRACQYSWLDVLELCLSAGADVDGLDGTGWTALAYAVRSWRPAEAAQRAPILSRLLRAGADPGFVLPQWRKDLRAMALDSADAQLCTLLGVRIPAPVGPAPRASSAAPGFVELTLRDRFTTASGAPGAEQRWIAWGRIPGTWMGATDRERDHWLLQPLRAAYRRMNAQTSDGSHQLLELCSRPLTAEETRQAPWTAPGRTLYQITDAEREATPTQD